MPEPVNLVSKIKERLPAKLVRLMEAIGAISSHHGQQLYLVGGGVRDLLLEQDTFDLDLVTDSNAINLAQLLANITGGKLVVHTRFLTANVRWNEWSIDLTTARSETYDHPGTLPRVKSGSLSDDLFRRDFTINTMAVRLNPGHFGDLVDLYGGMEDLRRGLIRILHERSFIDDATRIWRALRYEQRLSFSLEMDTLKLLRRDVTMLDTISGDRIRHELELVLKESYPEKFFLRANQLQILSRLQPGLRCDSWLSERFEQARQVSFPNPPPASLYIALLTYHMTGEQVEQLVKRLKLPRPMAQVLRDTYQLKTEIKSLAAADLKPSRVYDILHDYAPAAITATSLASDSPEVKGNIERYHTKLRYVKTSLTGEDLMKMGLTPDPRISEILNRLRIARLDGEVSNRQGEERLVSEWLASVLDN